MVAAVPLVRAAGVNGALVAWVSCLAYAGYRGGLAFEPCRFV